MNEYTLTLKIRTPEPIKVKRSKPKWEIYTEEQQRALVKVVSTFIENTEFYIVDGVRLEEGTPSTFVARPLLD